MFHVVTFSELNQVRPHTFCPQSFSLMSAWLMGAVPNIFVEQSRNRQPMSHITSEDRGFVIYDQDLFDSTASSSVVIIPYLS